MDPESEQSNQEGFHDQKQKEKLSKSQQQEELQEGSVIPNSDEELEEEDDDDDEKKILEAQEDDDDWDSVPVKEGPLPLNLQQEPKRGSRNRGRPTRSNDNFSKPEQKLQQQNFDSNSDAKQQQDEQQQGEKNDDKQRKGTQERRQLKSIILPIDSKIIYAISLLFWNQVRSLIPPKQGSLKCQPAYSKSYIKILYYDDEIGKKAADEIERFIEEKIEIVQIDSKIGECGIQYSKKYRKYLRSQHKVIFADVAKKKKELSYYICGRDSPTVLLQEASKLKNKKISFTWFNLFSYPDSRSYKKILSNFFQLPDIKKLLAQKFNAKDIEVGQITPSLPILNNNNKKFSSNGILCVLTFHSHNKLSVHQEIENALRDHIEKNYWLFCFTFLRESFNSFSSQWTPKMEGAHFFFIDERKISTPLSYLFIIVKKDQLGIMRQKIISEIEGMSRVRISGRRFFNGFEPRLGSPRPGLLSSQFPDYKPYSQSIWARKGQQFNWRRELEM